VPNLKERRQQIQQMSESEAQKELKELRLKLFTLRLQKQRGEVKNTRVFAQTKKDIARLLHHLGSLEREKQSESSEQ
jgi:ribosomal protein L29